MPLGNEFICAQGPSVTEINPVQKEMILFMCWLACSKSHSFKNDINWRKIEKSYKGKILDVLERRLLPGLRRLIKTDYIMTPLDFKERYLSHFGSGFSLEPQMFQSAWFRPHNRSKNLIISLLLALEPILGQDCRVF